jgi:hypothetical protein
MAYLIWRRSADLPPIRGVCFAEPSDCDHHVDNRGVDLDRNRHGARFLPRPIASLAGGRSAAVIIVGRAIEHESQPI